MTRTELKNFLTEFTTSLTLMVERDAKDDAVVDALTVLCDALGTRTEREFADHCMKFDCHEVLNRLEEATRVRRESGPLIPPPGTKL